MIPRIFFAIVYLPRFPGYIGYQKSGINIASFDQWGSFWDVTCNLDFTCIPPLRQNMATRQRVLVPWLDNLWLWGYSSSYQPYPEQTDLLNINKR
jgi:hypothetical protein